MATEISKVKGRPVTLQQFTINDSLIYTLKQLSGDSENSIINHFYNLGLELFTDSVSKKRMPQRCQRQVNTYYKNVDLQVRFEIRSGYIGDDEGNNNPIVIWMALNFCHSNTYLTGEDIVNAMVESSLDLSSQPVYSSSRPPEKLYKCLRKKDVDPGS